MFWRPAGTYRLNMLISEEKNRKKLKSGDFGAFFFTKILCMSCTRFFWLPNGKIHQKKDTGYDML